MELRKETRGVAHVKHFLFALTGLVIIVAPAMAVEQCRFIQSTPDREACYKRQEEELQARRKPEPSLDNKRLEALRQIHRDDGEVNRSMHSICRGC